MGAFSGVKKKNRKLNENQENRLKMMRKSDEKAQLKKARQIQIPLNPSNN
jgi:hypothetical protein